MQLKIVSQWTAIPGNVHTDYGQAPLQKMFLILATINLNSLWLQSVKCYPGGRKIKFIPSISQILSHMCHHCIQYTKHNESISIVGGLEVLSTPIGKQLLLWAPEGAHFMWLFFPTTRLILWSAAYTWRCHVDVMMQGTGIFHSEVLFTKKTSVFSVENAVLLE